MCSGTSTKCGFARQIFVECRSQCQVSLKSVQWEARRDGRTDMTKLTGAFGDCGNTSVKPALFSWISHLNKGKLNNPTISCIWPQLYLRQIKTRLRFTSLTIPLIFWLVLVPYCGPGSSVGIATRYRLDGSGIESRCGRDFPPFQNGPGAHPASCTMGTGSFRG